MGRLLYEKLLPTLKHQGFVKALAVIGCPNEGSELFHQKMGFSLVSTLVSDGEIQAYYSDEILDEYKKVLAYERLKKLHILTPARFVEIIEK